MSGAGERAGKRARAHGADDGQVEQRADQGHVAQEAERNREEVAAGQGEGQGEGEGAGEGVTCHE